MDGQGVFYFVVSALCLFDYLFEYLIVFTAYNPPIRRLSA